MSYTNEELSLKIKDNITNLKNSVITERFNDEYFVSLINTVLFGEPSDEIPDIPILEDIEDLPEIGEDITE